MRTFIGTLVLGTAAALAPQQNKHIKLSQLSKLAAPVTGVVALLAPAAAFAEEAGYEYGGVSAPSWVLPAGAVLAIATALLPLALQGGEEAANDIFDQSEADRSLDPKKRRNV